MDNDLTYFRRRAAQERAAALRASDPRARHAHLIMAQEYDARVRSLATDEGVSAKYIPRRVRARTWAVAKA